MLVRRAVPWTLAAAGQCRFYTPSGKEIQKLRYRTDAAIVDCKKALTATEGNFEEAITWLQKHGAAKAVKKSDRVTDYGMLAVACGSGAAAVLQICSETDFAARNEKFLSFADSTRKAAEKMFAETTHGLMEHNLSEADYATRTAEFYAQLQKAVEEERTRTVSAMGENIALKQVIALPRLDSEQSALAVNIADDRLFGFYVHNSIGDFSRIGMMASIVQLQPRDADGSVASLPEKVPTSEIAQHCVANFSNDAVFGQQKVLGTDETTGQWMKRYKVKLQRSLTVKFGEAPLSNTLVVPKK